jgi:phage tail-like protein
MAFTSFFIPALQAAGKYAREALERTPQLAAHLPGIYHEDAERKLSPLWALLLFMEDNFAKITKTLDDIDKYFDPRRAPAGEGPGEKDFLTWLGLWVGMIPAPHWSIQKKRYALGIAADLHKYRGTITGLRCMLALFFEIDAEIEEWTWTKGMQIGLHNTIEMDTHIDERFDIDDCFTVTWKPRPEEFGPDLKYKIAAVRHMIDREKPAHTFCYLNVVGYKE